MVKGVLFSESWASWATTFNVLNNFYLFLMLCARLFFFGSKDMSDMYNISSWMCSNSSIFLPPSLTLMWWNIWKRWLKALVMILCNCLESLICNASEMDLMDIYHHAHPNWHISPSCFYKNVAFEETKKYNNPPLCKRRRQTKNI